MKNKKYLWISVTVLLIAGSAFYLTTRQTPSNSDVQSKRLPFKEWIRSPRIDYLVNKSSSTNKVSENSPDNLSTSECTQYQKSLLSLDFNVFKFPPKITTVPKLPANCLLDGTAKLVEEITQKCSQFMDTESPPKALTPDQWEKDFSACKISMFFLRSRIVAKQFENQKLEDIKDMKVLSDLLLAAFSKTEGNSAVTFTEIGKIAERMLEIDPSLYFAAKVGVMAKVMDVLPQLNGKDPADWTKVEAAIERAQGYGQYDQELAELILFAKSQGFNKADLIQTELAKIDQAFPDSGLSDYYRAYFAWKAGNREQTISHLTDALNKSPEDSRFKSSLAKVKDPNVKPGEGSPFIIALKLGIDAGDV